MSSLNSFFHPPIERIQRWLHGGPTGHPDTRPTAEQAIGMDLTPGPGHAPGHRHLGPPPEVPMPRSAGPAPQHHPHWLGTGGRVDRQRRNERHGDESKD